MTVSHTEPITVGAEQGLIGLVAYVALIVVALWTMGAGLWARGPDRRLTVFEAGRAAVLAAFVALLVHTMAYAGFFQDPITWVLLAVGASLAAARVPAPADQGRRERRAAHISDRGRRHRRVGSPRVGIPAATGDHRRRLHGGEHPLEADRGRAAAALHAHLAPADYGAAELLFAAVVTASIVVRLGLIESVLRFYYRDDEDPDRVVAATFSGLFWFATIGALIALPFAKPLAELVLDLHNPAELQTGTELTRIAIGGLWVLTMFEYLLTLYRLDERARAYFITTITNVVATIALTVVLVVGFGDGARGLLLGSYLSGAVFVVALIFEQRRRLTLRLELPLLRRLLRFGLPTMPAEVSLYLLNFADRLIITRSVGGKAGLAEAGLYSVGVKFAQAVNVLVRGFQLAWPPLAYSIRDDDEARRTYATVITLFLAACTWLVVGLWLLAIYLITLLHRGRNTTTPTKWSAWSPPASPSTRSTW